MNIHNWQDDLKEQNSIATNWDENDERWLILIGILLEEENSNKLIADDWINFDKDIKNRSRFFPKGNLLEVIKNLSDEATFKLEKDNMLYRARVFDKPFLGYYEADKRKILNILLKYYPNIKDKNTIEEIYYFIITDEFRTGRTELYKELNDFFGKRRRFWGYNTKDSDAAPSEVTSYGRANANHISYLYAADNLKTAISEVRPHTDQDVSVATIRIENNLKLYDFCSDKSIADIEARLLLNKISRLFSIPQSGDEIDYYVTQYISEYICTLGFDGLRFNSSLNQSGHNIVLFNTNEHSDKKNYTILNSKVYSVTKVDVQYRQIAPRKK